MSSLWWKHKLCRILDTFGKTWLKFNQQLRVYKFIQKKEKVLEKMSQKKLNILLKIPIISSIIKKIRAALGWSKVRIIVSGAAAMPVPLLEWYKTTGVYIVNGYGMTENCCVCTNLDPFQPLGVGSVGKKSSPVLS